MLRGRDMRLYLAGRFAAGTALMLLRSTITWQVYEISGSALQLGLIGLAQFVPTVLLSLLAGAVADSYDRRRVVIAAQGVTLLGSALLLALSTTDVISLTVIYGVISLTAAAASFENPAGAAILPALVPRALFPSAVAVQGSVRNLAWVSGPVIMGFVVDAWGPAGAYALHMALVAVSIACIARLHLRRHGGERRGVTLEAIREGIGFVRARPVILGSMTLDMLAVLFGAAEALLPIFAADVLQVGAKGYGLLSASFQLGTLTMALLLVALPPMRYAGRALLLAVTGYGLATIGFGLSRLISLSLLCYGAAGMADQVSMVARSTLIQLSTPDELRGRVNSVNFIFIGASNQLGAAEAGFLAALTGAPFAVVAGGVLALAVTAWIGWRVPALRRYDVRATLSDQNLL